MSDIASIIAAFEAGSGLNVGRMGFAFALLGFVGVVFGIAWSILQQAPAVGRGKLTLFEAYGRAFVGLLVMAFCLSLFTAGSPLSP